MNAKLTDCAIKCANELISGLSCVHCSDVRFVMEASPIIQKHMATLIESQQRQLVDTELEGKVLRDLIERTFEAFDKATPLKNAGLVQCVESMAARSENKPQ